MKNTKIGCIYKLLLIILLVSGILFKCHYDVRNREVSVITINISGAIKLDFAIFAYYVDAMPGWYEYEPMLIIYRNNDIIQKLYTSKYCVPHKKLLIHNKNYVFKFDDYANTSNYLNYLNKIKYEGFKGYGRCNFELDLYIDEEKFTYDEFLLIKNYIISNREEIYRKYQIENIEMLIKNNFPNEYFSYEKARSIAKKITSIIFYNYTEKDVTFTNSEDEEYTLIVNRNGEVCLANKTNESNGKYESDCFGAHLGNVSQDDRYIALHIPKKYEELFGIKAIDKNIVKSIISKYKDNNSNNLFYFYDVFPYEHMSN